MLTRTEVKLLRKAYKEGKLTLQGGECWGTKGGKRCLAAFVAELRGAKFDVGKVGLTISYSELSIALRALEDVAEWFGLCTVDYLEALETKDPKIKAKLEGTK